MNRQGWNGVCNVWYGALKCLVSVECQVKITVFRTVNGQCNSTKSVQGNPKSLGLEIRAAKVPGRACLAIRALPGDPFLLGLSLLLVLVLPLLLCLCLFSVLSSFYISGWDSHRYTLTLPSYTCAGLVSAPNNLALSPIPSLFCIPRASCVVLFLVRDFPPVSRRVTPCFPRLVDRATQRELRVSSLSIQSRDLRDL